MAWLQLHIPCAPEQVQAIEEQLQNLGALSITYRDHADQPILEPALGETPLWRQTAITALFDSECDCDFINQQLTQGVANPAAHHWEIVEDKDWEREWMQHFQPIHCGGQLWICPSWREPPEPDAVNVMLDPGLAFGTGTHPTTLLCLQWLAEFAATNPLRDLNIIDYGCGSGILGIAALKLGGKQLLGIDIDPQALLATRDNAERNHIAPTRVTTSLPAAATLTPAPLVFANILAGPLIDLAPTLINCLAPQGWLCLSGILTNQGDQVVSAYADHCELITRRRQEEWLQLVLRRC